jgi:adenosine deaminase
MHAYMRAGDRTLAECFKLFDVIHRITTDHDVITRITREVVEDFAADNVRYLELRTTPKVGTMSCPQSMPPASQALISSH